MSVALAGRSPSTFDLKSANLPLLALRLKSSELDVLADELQAQRNTMMNASFLRASLFTSVLAYGVSLLVMGLGVMFLLLGWAFGSLARPKVVTADA